MSFFALMALSFGMSMDAFAAALSCGARLTSPNVRLALKTGLIFGVVEAMTPLIGYGLGLAAAAWVADWDHWLSFVLLGALGVRTIYEAFNESDSDADTATKNSLIMTILTAFATSIDAMVVGVTLALAEVNIWLACLLIGLATTVMASLGVYFGHRLGVRFGKWAQVAGGVVLIGIGSSILVTHLW